MLLGRMFQRSKSDNKAFLLIRLNKYQNPHENSCSKVISILITGNSLHESSSAPQQHKSVQYKWFALYLHRDVSYTFHQLQRGFGGRRQHEQIQEFLSVLFRPQLILQFKEGECPDPLSPSGSANGQCHHNGTIFITVQPLTIIVRN